jgi:hypothetical protein
VNLPTAIGHLRESIRIPAGEPDTAVLDEVMCLARLVETLR